jgi:two-component system LytT family response regulator
MAARIRTLLVDDESLARDLLRDLLAAHPDVEIAGECANGFEAVKAVAELDPALIFLDVQMPKLSGFEVLELIERPVLVVFTTAYEEHALRAFEVHAVDYLLKPFAPERLAAALDRVRARHAVPPPAAALAAAARLPGQPLDRIVVRDGARVHILPVAQLDFVEAQDDYVALWSEGKHWLKSETLAGLEAGLDPRRFVRIHRSYLLNIERLARIEPAAAKDSRVAVLKDGRTLPVSRAGYARLRVLLG